MRNKILKSILFVLLFLFAFVNSYAQQNGLTNTKDSPYAKLRAVDLTDVVWTDGFWAERFSICRDTMVPHMMSMYMDEEISHAYTNFEIAAGLKEGEHLGPPFHDGDFYKILEGLIVVYSVTKNEETGRQIDEIIDLVGKTQREDGYIHTPVVIKQIQSKDKSAEFAERLDFETYNMGHLMTTACIHYRLTGKTYLLDIAKKATDFLYNYYKIKPEELAENAICPSHYMGVAEMYRTTNDARYLELAKGLIDIRSMVKDGTDHNQDRIPFRKQTQAIGHAVRANYLYAGVADVYAETGDDSLMAALNSIWHDLIEKKLYITGACGALYDGVSPNGTTYDPKIIQQVHQAYGQDYQLPNHTAHNESCANIGNLLWNWRMLQATGNAQYADVMEQVLYNSLLAGVSLNGKGYFYANPLAVSKDLPYELRWSKVREEYISYCNCCPPNTIRTIAEVQNYVYSISDEGLWVNLYGAGKLSTVLNNSEEIELEQETDYPWNGNVKFSLEKAPKNVFSIFLRIPGWADKASILINGVPENLKVLHGNYTEISRKWKKGDVIELYLPMEANLIESNPLVEETRNRVAVRRGPVVYCLESIDIPEGSLLSDIIIPANIELKPEKEILSGSTITSLKGEGFIVQSPDWSGKLYQKIGEETKTKIPLKLIPYYAWGNRGVADMEVWLPLTR